MTNQGSYRELVREVWDAISIHDGEELFLEQYAAAPSKQRTLFAAYWAFSEIQNGGLGQFFGNSTGVLAPEAAAAFATLELPECSQVLRQAMAFFGDPYPRDRSRRQTIWERFVDAHEGEDAMPIRDLEDRMARLVEEENGGFEPAADTFAAGHRA